MTLAPKITEQRTIGDHNRVVCQVQSNRNNFSIDITAKFMHFPIDDCKKNITLLDEHPDWMDDEVADHVMWEEWK